MKFLCLGYMAETTWNGMTEHERDTLVQDCLAYDKFLLQEGYWTGTGEPMQSAQHAKTLRLKQGEVMITDGPYAETKEQLGGLGILAARDMQQAVELFSKHPAMKHSTFEIRPLDQGTTDACTSAAPPADDPANGAKIICFGCFDEKTWGSLSPSEEESLKKQCMEYADVLTQRGGTPVLGAALQRVSTAKTLRLKNGQVTVTDGPYAETKEQIGGVAIYRFRDMEQAIEAWKDHPCLKIGDTLELRPTDEKFAAHMNEQLAQMQEQ